MRKVASLWPILQKMGPSVTVSGLISKKGKAQIHLQHPDKGFLLLDCDHDFAPSVSLPKNLDGGTLEPETVNALRTLVATAGKEDDHSRWGLSGVRLTPAYAAATNGTTISVIWQETKVPESVTIPTNVVKRIKGEAFKVKVTRNKVFLTEGTKTYWSRRVATQWPESTVNDLIPQRRAVPEAVTFKIPDQFTESVEVVSLIPQGAGTPSKLVLKNGVLTIVNDHPSYRNSWSVPVEDDIEMTVGMSPTELLKCLKLLPEEGDKYLSLAGVRQAIMVYSVGKTSIECLTMPIYAAP